MSKNRTSCSALSFIRIIMHNSCLANHDTNKHRWNSNLFAYTHFYYKHIKTKQTDFPDLEKLSTYAKNKHTEPMEVLGRLIFKNLTP